MENWFSNKIILSTMCVILGRSDLGGGREGERERGKERQTAGDKEKRQSQKQTEKTETQRDRSRGTEGGGIEKRQ